VKWKSAVYFVYIYQIDVYRDNHAQGEEIVIKGNANVTMVGQAKNANLMVYISYCCYI
jgi:hypothetical protein